MLKIHFRTASKKDEDNVPVKDFAFCMRLSHRQNKMNITIPSITQNTKQIIQDLSLKNAVDFPMFCVLD